MIENVYLILKNRPYQIEVIEKILDKINDKKFILLDSPTGSGKTLMALCLADYLWKNEDSITHIAVRTNEQIKRYLQDSEKIKTIVKIFPNKRKTCPIFCNSNLSGEEIYCSDCIYREKIFTPRKLMRIVKKLNYNFEKIAKIENKILKKNPEKIKCVYQSFKKIDSNIFLSTYPYVFNKYLFDLLSFEGEPDYLILDESHNLLTTVTNPVSISFRKYLEKGFGKRKEENLLYKELKEELIIIFDILNTPKEDRIFILDQLSKFSDSLINYIEDILVKNYKTRDILVLLEKIKKNIGIKEILVNREEILDIFDRYKKMFEDIVFLWDSYKKTIARLNIKIPKKRWNLNKIIKLYLNLKDPNLLWILNGFKLEAYLTRFDLIIRSLLDYKNIILMSGSNFNKKDFSLLYKINPEEIEHIKVNIKMGEKEYKILGNFSSKYEKRKDKNNIENLIGNINFIINNLEEYQLYMFPSAGFMNYIYDLLDDSIKEKIFLDEGNKPFNYILKTNKKAIFTYSRSRFVEGVELTKNSESLLKVIVIVGKPYPPPPTVSILTTKILKDNKLDYGSFAEILKDIQIRQVIGRAIRFPTDKVKIFFIDERYKKSEVVKYIK